MWRVMMWDVEGDGVECGARVWSVELGWEG